MMFSCNVRKKLFKHDINKSIEKAGKYDGELAMKGPSEICG